jgi:hypothetical protein
MLKDKKLQHDLPTVLINSICTGGLVGAGIDSDFYLAVSVNLVWRVYPPELYFRKTRGGVKPPIDG